VSGGRSQSVLADSVHLTGTIRTVDEALRARLRTRLEQVVAGVASAGGATADVEWANAMPAVRNHAHVVARAHSVLADRLGAHAVRHIADPPMTTDDFALYAERVPGLYLKLGVAGPDGCHPLHHSLFDVDERALTVGVDTLDVLVRSLLSEPLG
jgi:metal-dependent amidase/aminoacylase/carboxypeptidase family protein